MYPDISCERERPNFGSNSLSIYSLIFELR